MKRLAVLLLAVVLLGCAPAWAEDAPPAASWSQLRRTTPLGDTPDVDGGLAVQNGPAGVAAYTAVRTAVFAKEAVLTLTLADGGSTQTPVVWACPATAAWQPGAAPAPAAALPATVAGAPGQNPVVAQDSQPVATALAATRAPGSHRSVGAGLIALLALLLMVRTALPSKPLAAPTSLLRRPGRGSTSSPDL
ncbi:MAG: hypothetical protein LC779_00500 [Actinobacteria bacterium]|nr:hypothetical protein [Actinomycetota bacterium]